MWKEYFFLSTISSYIATTIRRVEGDTVVYRMLLAALRIYLSVASWC